MTHAKYSKNILKNAMLIKKIDEISKSCPRCLEQYNQKRSCFCNQHWHDRMKIFEGMIKK